MKTSLLSIKAFCLFTILAFTYALKSQTIAITETLPTELLCAGQTVSVSFNTTGTFNAGNSFQIQLSNAAGSFTTPTTIGTYSWSGTIAQNHTVSASIPGATVAGTGYRIRIVSTNPAITGINTFKQYIVSNRCGCNTDLIQKDFDADFGGTGSDQLIKIVSSTGGGLLLAGTSDSPVSGNKTVASNGMGDYYVVKLDNTNTVQWQKSYGGTLHDELKSAVQLSDGGYLLVGISQSGIDGNKTAANNGLYDIWVVRLTSTGTKLWDRSFGGTQADFAYDIKAAEDGNYYIIGTSASLPDANKTSANYGGYDYWVIKINTAGAKLWESTFGGTTDDIGLRIATKTNGNLIFGGYSRSLPGTGNKTSVSYGLADYWLVEINSTGTIIRQDSYGGAQDDIFQDMILTTDNSILMTGTSESGVSGNKTTSNFGTKDMWIVKENNAVIQWQKNYGTTNIDPSMSLKEANDGSYLICGSAVGIDGNKTSAAYGLSDMWIISLEQDGSEIVQESFGGTNADQANTLTYTSDGGFIVGGYSKSIKNTGNKETDNYGMEDFWLIKLKILPMRYTLNNTTLCLSAIDTAKIKINCSNLGSNIVQVQLSNTSGSFATPVILASQLPSSTNINLPYSVPVSVSPGTYKIRVVINSTPAYIGDTIANIIVNEAPTLSGVNEVCALGKNLTALGLQSYATKQWQLNGTNISGETNDAIFPNQFGNYQLVTTVGTCVVKSSTFTIQPAHTNSVSNLTLNDGVQRLLCDNTTGNVLAKVTDAAGGNILNTTAAYLNIDATLQNYAGQPYNRRHWDITPISSGAATVTVYIQQSDFDYYNANAPAVYPKMPTGPSDAAGKANVVLMQCHGTSPTRLPGTYSGSTEFFDKTKYTLNWNATYAVWELSFNPTAFSGIFLITLAPNVLPVQLTEFTGKYNAEKDAVALNWQTASENNCSNFTVERYNETGGYFEAIGQQLCKGTNMGTTYYDFFDKHYLQGENLYRLKQYDFDGSTHISNMVSVKINTAPKAEWDIKAWLYNTNLYINTNEQAEFALSDINGKTIMIGNCITNTSYTIPDLPNGLYILILKTETATKSIKLMY